MNKDLREQLRAIRHIALDMDGTIYLSNTIQPYRPMKCISPILTKLQTGKLFRA